MSKELNKQIYSVCKGEFQSKILESLNYTIPHVIPNYTKDELNEVDYMTTPLVTNMILKRSKLIIVEGIDYYIITSVKDDNEIILRPLFRIGNVADIAVKYKDACNNFVIVRDPRNDEE